MAGQVPAWESMGEEIDFLLPTRLVHGPGSLARLGELARSLGFGRVLLVADPGMVAIGYVERVAGLLGSAGMEVVSFHSFGENPDSAAVEAGRLVAESERVDSMVALGGGSSLDCARGINLVLTGGGVIADYLGHGRLSAKTASGSNSKRMLPMIGIPTTAGTGSEAQSYALISDSETHAKMACGDPQAAFRVALLDPELTRSMPRGLTAVTGYDAISHAVESFVTRKRNAVSRLFAREAWRLLQSNFERVLDQPEDLRARGEMQLGAFLAGVAIEASMLGATHSCANPLTKNFGTPHGEAISIMLPSLVRWNAAVVGEDYAELLAVAGLRAEAATAGEALARRLERMRAAGSLPQSLGAIGVGPDDLPALADEASRQWTGNFNPRQWSAAAALEVYREAL